MKMYEGGRTVYGQRQSFRGPHTEDIWKGASKRMREQMVREVEGKSENACHVSLGRVFQEDT